MWRSVPLVTSLALRSSILLAAIALLTTGLSATADQVSATVFQVSGTAESAAPGTVAFSPMTKGEVLPVGTTIRTGDNGSAVITTTPGSAINVGANSKLKLNELAFAKSGSDVTQREAHIELTSGVVTALIDPSTPKITDFRIQTSQGGASARGTIYGVAVYDGKTYVSVKQGKVAAAPTAKSK